MSSHAIVIPRISDEAALEGFGRIIKTFEPNSAHVRLPGLSKVLDLRKDDSGVLKQFRDPESFSLSEINLGYDNFTVQYYRGGQPSNDKRQSFRTDEIVCAAGQHYGNDRPSLDDETRAAIVRLVTRTFGPTLNTGSPSAGGLDRVRDLDLLYESTVLKLEGAFAGQIEKITSWTVEQAEEFEKRKAELATQFEDQKVKLHAEIESRQKELAEAERLLNERSKALDNRDNTHVRRELRRDLQKLASQREQQFRLTESTRRLRSPVHAAMIMLIAVLVAINLGYFWYVGRFTPGIENSAYVAVSILLKQGLLAAALIGTVLYYVRWMNRWFEEHATAEFLLKQFQIDIDRASWVVETALEWRRDQHAEIPASLLEGISRNLFAFERGDSHADKTAVDDLASALIGNASNLKLKVGQNEVSLDRKSLSKLAKG